MSWQTPPQSWEMSVGTWGVDADREETIARSGNASLLMKSTAVATTLRSGWIPVENGVIYGLWALVRSDDVTVGNYLSIDAQEYDGDKSTLTATTPVVNSRLPAVVDTWEWHGAHWTPAVGTTRWIRLIIKKTAVAFSLYWDKIHFEIVNPATILTRDATQSIPDATWTTVEFNNKLIAGAIWRVNDAPAAGILTLPIGGQYAVSATVEFASSAIAAFDIRFKHLYATSVVDYYYGVRQILAINGQVVRLSVTTEMLLSRGMHAGEQITVEVYHNSGGALNIAASTLHPTGNSLVNHLSAHRIKPV